MYNIKNMNMYGTFANLLSPNMNIHKTKLLI